MKTAVEWLIESIETIGFKHLITDDTIQQAKEMEKEQIIDAWNKRGMNIVPRYFLEENIEGEEYYNRTFKSK
jgi:hypothetical protein